MNIIDAAPVFTAAFAADDSVLMTGLHGIGKSDIVKTWANKNSFHMEALFLSMMDVGDLLGIPTITEGPNGEKVTTWAEPDWFQNIMKAHRDGKHCVLFLDEMNRAHADTRNASLQLVLERRLHNHILPSLNGKRTLIVSAINPPDGYQVDEMDPALMDRFLTLDVEVDTPSWLNWARTNNVNSIVREFITQNQTKLHWQPEDGGTGATPRSWTKLGAFVDNIKSTPANIHFNIIKGKIGQELGGQFLSFMNRYVDIIKIEDVIKLVDKLTAKNKSIDKIGEAVAELTKKTEAITQTELNLNIVEHFIGEGKNPALKDAMPMMGMLYSLPIEILNSFLKSFKEDKDGWDKLTALDKELSNKKLFLKVIDFIED